MRHSQPASSELEPPTSASSNSALRPSLPRAVHFGREYWLSRCDGYRVESPSGQRVGVVEGTRFHTRYDCPDFLVVRIGHFRAQHETVPIADVAEIEPNKQLIRVSCTIGDERPHTVRVLWKRISHSLHSASP